MKKNIYIIGVSVIVVIGLFIYISQNGNMMATISSISLQHSASTTETAAPWSIPLSPAKARITKKHLGTYVRPGDSPVSPERFTGYHTGVDFETFPSEATSDVPIMAICTGKLLEKEWASGYGGMAVQSCTYQNQPVTVVYGHLRLSSIKPSVGDIVTAGNFLANLGTGYSSETDGERKHLHLGIHKGAAIDTRGYVADKSLLSNWIDFEQFLK